MINTTAAGLAEEIDISLYRLKSEFSHPEAAKQIGVSARTLYRIRKGHSSPSTTQIQSIASFLGITVSELFRRAEAVAEAKQSA